MELIATSQFHFHIPKVEVSQEHIFSFQSNEREGSELHGSVINLVRLQWKKPIPISESRVYYMFLFWLF
jgi:hypothetical protein